MSSPFDDKPKVDDLNEDYNDPNLNNVHVRLRDKEITHLIEIRKEYRLALAELIKKNPLAAEKVNQKDLDSISKHQLIHYLIQFSFKHKWYLGRLIARMALEHTTDLDIYEKRHGIDIVGDEYSRRIYSQNYVDFYSSPNPVVNEFSEKKGKPKSGKGKEK